MILEHKKKIEGGKFARIRIVVSDDSLESVRITGDFFLYPEGALEKIEGSLKGSRIPFNEDEAEKKILGVLKEEDAELVGITPKDLAEMIGECLK